MISKTIFSITFILILTVTNLSSSVEAFKLIENNSKNSELKLKIDNNLLKSGATYYTEKYYVFGNRIAGDKMISEFTDKLSFPSETDKEVELTFPKDNTKQFKVSQIKIYVDQSSKNGTAYIVDGGPNEYFVKVLIKAEKTMWFGYIAECYGY